MLNYATEILFCFVLRRHFPFNSCIRNFWNRQMVQKCPWKGDRKSDNCYIFKMRAILPKILEILRENHDQVKGKLLFRIFSTTWVYLTSLSITYMYLIITNQSSRCQHGRILLNFFTVLIYFFYIFLQQLNDLFQCIKVCLGLIFQVKSYK